MRDYYTTSEKKEKLIKENTLVKKKYDTDKVTNLIQNVLREFRRDILPFGQVSDFELMKFTNTWIKKHL